MSPESGPQEKVPGTYSRIHSRVRTLFSLRRVSQEASVLGPPRPSKEKGQTGPLGTSLVTGRGSVDPQLRTHKVRRGKRTWEIRRKECKREPPYSKPEGVLRTEREDPSRPVTPRSGPRARTPLPHSFGPKDTCLRGPTHTSSSPLLLTQRSGSGRD